MALERARRIQRFSPSGASLRSWLTRHRQKLKMLMTMRCLRWWSRSSQSLETQLTAKMSWYETMRQKSLPHLPSSRQCCWATRNDIALVSTRRTVTEGLSPHTPAHDRIVTFGRSRPSWPGGGAMIMRSLSCVPGCEAGRPTKKAMCWVTKAQRRIQMMKANMSLQTMMAGVIVLLSKAVNCRHSSSGAYTMSSISFGNAGVERSQSLGSILAKPKIGPHHESRARQRSLNALLRAKCSPMPIRLGKRPISSAVYAQATSMVGPDVPRQPSSNVTLPLGSRTS
mmetsp:Transcript_5248/g.13239  ORF Transcript_5248/g.13239 Transcript_5248/m.13239 type:complete len:283 (-) Transcript_5248:528-1376(-)